MVFKMAVQVPHGRSREEGERRRAEILDHAERIIGKRGYNGFSIQELAQSCGLSKPGVLHHFGSKEQLLITLLRDREATHESAIAAKAAARAIPATTPAERLQNFIVGMASVLERDIAQPGLTRLHATLRAEALDEDHPAHGYFKERAAAKQQILTDHLAGLVSAPRACARQILALMAGLTEQWFREEPGFDVVSEFESALGHMLEATRCD